MSLYSGYIPAGGACAGGPQPGAVALMAWYLAAYRTQHATNDGIYNCRDQRGADVPSVHGEGRAVDLGCPAGGGRQSLANWLVRYSKQLGVQCVIYDRHIWSGAHPQAGWRPYHGVDAHTTHLHVELAWAAARGPQALTVDHIQSVWRASHKTAGPTLSRYLRQGNTGTAVRALQRALHVPADGDFGPVTAEAVALFQRKHHIHADGIVGPQTARALGWVWKG